MPQKHVPQWLTSSRQLYLQTLPPLSVVNLRQIYSLLQGQQGDHIWRQVQSYEDEVVALDILESDLDDAAVYKVTASNKLGKVETA